MVDIVAPDLNELGQLCDFAESRIIDLKHQYDDGEAEADVSEWEEGCLEKTRAWIKALNEAMPADHVRLANEALDASGLCVQGVLCISLNHLSADTIASFAITSSAQLVKLYGAFRLKEQGYMFAVDGGGVALADFDDVRDAIFFARSLKCKWLMLMDGAPETSALPAYEW